MLYEMLNPEMQRMVDNYAKKARTMTWQHRSNLFAEAAVPFSDQFGSRQAYLATQGFLTAIIERLAPKTVDDPHQAYLLLRSLNPKHRHLALSTLQSQPHLLDGLETSLGGVN